MKAAIALLLALQSFTPVVRYDERGRMIYVTGLLDPSEVATCSRFDLRGAVRRVEYDSAGAVAAFTLTGSRSRLTLNVDDSRLPPPDVPRLRGLVRKGKRLRVVAFGCGAGASIVEADEIRGL